MKLKCFFFGHKLINMTGLIFVHGTCERCGRRVTLGD